PVRHAHRLRVKDEQGLRRCRHEERRRLRAATRNFKSILASFKNIAVTENRIDRIIVIAEMEARPKAETNATRSGKQPPGDKNGVLPVCEQNPLFQHRAIEIVDPYRKSQLEAELDGIRRNCVLSAREFPGTCEE